MDILEHQIEDLIYKNLKTKEGKNLLRERGLWFVNQYDLYERQLDLNKYGRLDIIGINYEPHPPYLFGGMLNKTVNVALIEIKKEEINYNTFIQAVKYCRGIQMLLDSSYTNITFDFKIILIGKTICKSDFCYLPNVLDNLYIFTYSIDLKNGVLFNRESNYCISDHVPSLSTEKQIAFENYMFEKVKRTYSEFIDDENPF